MYLKNVLLKILNGKVLMSGLRFCHRVAGDRELERKVYQHCKWDFLLETW